jgi:hypothetical protein
VGGGDICGLRGVPPLIFFDRCQCRAGGGAFGSEARLGFVRRLGVVVFLLPPGFLTPACQRFGDPRGDHQGLPHAVVEKVVDAVCFTHGVPLALVV